MLIDKTTKSNEHLIEILASILLTFVSERQQTFQDKNHSNQNWLSSTNMRYFQVKRTKCFWSFIKSCADVLNRLTLSVRLGIFYIQITFQIENHIYGEWMIPVNQSKEFSCSTVMTVAHSKHLTIEMLYLHVTSDVLFPQRDLIMQSCPLNRKYTSAPDVVSSLKHL